MVPDTGSCRSEIPSLLSPLTQFTQGIPVTAHGCIFVVCPRLLLLPAWLLISLLSSPQRHAGVMKEVNQNHRAGVLVMTMWKDLPIPLSFSSLICEMDFTRSLSV